MIELKRVCDLCGKTVDYDDPTESDEQGFSKYSLIDIKVEARNPLKRCMYSSRGSLIFCETCMNDKVYKMPFSKLMDKMVERVNKD